MCPLRIIFWKQVCLYSFKWNVHRNSLDTDQLSVKLREENDTYDSIDDPHALDTDTLEAVEEQQEIIAGRLLRLTSCGTSPCLS